jgi:hypothetical protein
MLFGNPVVVGSGPAGAPVYLYQAWASDASGTNFTTTFDASLDYTAFKISYIVLTPVVGDFTGLWKNYKGAQGVQGPISDYVSFSELTTALANHKIPINDGSYKYITRQNLLMGVAGGINFNLNPNFEGDTVGQLPSGYAVYADAAGVAPVDGIGGSPSSTLLCSTTNVLNGTKSARFSKDAANRQGCGFSYDVTVPIGYRSQVCKVQMLIDPVNTISTGDFCVYLYDVTNSVLIQPTPYQIPGLVAGTPYLWQCEFQVPYNCANIRLIWHIATTSTSALAVDIDEIIVEPGTVQNSVYISDWQEYTPTIAGYGSGTPVLAKNAWRRVGDSIQIIGGFQNTGAGSGANPVTISLPPGIVFDPTIMDTNIIGYARIYNIRSLTWFDSAYPGYYDSTHFALVARTSGGWIIGSEIADAGRAHWFVQFKVVGWGSNCQMSSDAETREVSAHCYLSTTPSIGPNAGVVKIPLNSVSNDTHGGFDAANSRYTIKVPGRYHFDFRMSTAPTNTLANRYMIWLYKNGAISRRGGDTLLAAAGAVLGLTGSTVVDCVAGDYFEVFLYGTGNNSVNTIPLDGSTDITYLDIYRISGPSQIAASEKVYSEYSSNAQQTIADSSIVRLDFEDKIEDTHGAVTIGASWQWVAPRAGIIQYSAQVFMGATGFSGTGEYINMIAYKNGVVQKYEYMTPPAGAVGVTPKIAGIMKVNAGDIIYFAAYQTSGASINLGPTAEYNKVSILMQ